MKEVKKGRMKDVTFGNFLCLVRPEKAGHNRTRFVVGGDRINYPGEVGTTTAEMLVAKILFNSVISTKKRTLREDGHRKFLPCDSIFTSRIHSC